VPIYAVAPLIAFVGLLIVADSIEHLPLRHAPALIIGIVPAVADWAGNNCSLADGEGNSCFVNTNPVGAGLRALQNGYMINSMMITSIFALIIDRKYLSASAWTAIAALFSLFGIMHQSEINADFDEGGHVSKWRYCVGYLIVMAFLLIFKLRQAFNANIGLGDGVLPPVEDEHEYMSVGELIHLASATAPDELKPERVMSKRSAIKSLRAEQQVATATPATKQELDDPENVTFSSAA